MSVKSSRGGEIEIKPIIIRPWEPAIMHSLMISQYSNVKGGAISFDEIAIDVECSGGHVHLSKKHAEILYPGIDLKEGVAELEIPGQYASKYCVFIKGPNGKMKKRRILVPFREETQFEDSFTNLVWLGYDRTEIKVCESGCLKNTLPLEIYAIKVENGKDFPDSTRYIRLNRGAMVAINHIHMDPLIGEYLDIKDRSQVNILIKGDRPVTFHKVLVRYQVGLGTVKMHIDYDAGNAAMIENAKNQEIMGPVHPVGIMDLPYRLIIIGVPKSFESSFIPISEHNIPIACMITPWRRK